MAASFRPITARSNALTMVSLYSGAGGLDLGFASQGFQPVWSNEIDPVAAETYDSLFDGHAVHVGDIRDQVLPCRGSADLVIGGPPCQGFSIAGKMNPDDPRSRHVWDFMRVVAHVQPRAFCMENVKALAVNRRWSGLVDALRLEGERLGYRTSLVILDASHFGVPQKRERMFLIGTANGKAVEAHPTTASSPPSVRRALETLPRYGEPGNSTRCPAIITPALRPVLRRSPFAGMLFNGQGRPLNLDVPAPTLPATMGGNRTPVIDQHELDFGDECWVIGYHRRLWSGKPPIRNIPSRLRRLTVEEAGAIQTFPLGMWWSGRLSQQFRQIGNAVPPTLAGHVAAAIRHALEDRSDRNVADHRESATLRLVA